MFGDAHRPALAITERVSRASLCPTPVGVLSVVSGCQVALTRILYGSVALERDQLPVAGNLPADLGTARPFSLPRLLNRRFPVLFFSRVDLVKPAGRYDYGAKYGRAGKSHFRELRSQPRGKRECQAVRKFLHALKWVLYDVALFILGFTLVTFTEQHLFGTGYAAIPLLLAFLLIIPYRFFGKMRTSNRQVARDLGLEMTAETDASGTIANDASGTIPQTTEQLVIASRTRGEKDITRRQAAFITALSECSDVEINMGETDLGMLSRRQASDLIDRLLDMSDRDLYEETNERKEQLVDDPNFYPELPELR